MHITGVRIAVGIIVAIIAGFVGLAVLISLTFPGAPPGESELAQLKADSQTLIDQVGHYRAEHGEYPLQLAQAGITAPPNRYGGWAYSREGAGFSVWTANYRKHGFFLSWSNESGTGRWWFDH